jgi:hypothetical protein
MDDKKTNLSVADIIKIFIGLGASGMGGVATYNVGSAAEAIKDLRGEVRETRREITKVHSSLVEVVTIQSLTVKRVDDHEGRIRRIEIK